MSFLPQYIFSYKVIILLREIFSKTKLYKKIFHKSYQFNFHPSQIVLFCNLLKEASRINGSIVEVGCNTGSTTLFLNKYLESLNSNKIYYALDTFNGFPKEDILFEENKRGKKKGMYKDAFKMNSLKLFEERMSVNNLKNVKAISCDVKDFNFSDIAPFSFVLLDVDLYKPIKNVLVKIFPLMSPGGIIVVDDCNKDSQMWDGAYQAFKEFVEENNLESEIILDKIGLIKIQK